VEKPRDNISQTLYAFALTQAALSNLFNALNPSAYMIFLGHWYNERLEHGLISAHGVSPFFNVDAWRT
jgi:hypothetical protein